MKVSIYNKEGKKAGTMELPASVFGHRWNAALVKQVVDAHQANARTPAAHVKDRGAVRGGGKKPWRQKGTGRARHGSIRSPLWKGGGVTHGPTREKDFSKKLPRTMQRKALLVSLSQKAADGDVLVVDAMPVGVVKTKDVDSFITSLAGIPGFERLNTKGGKVLLAFAAHDATLARAARNLAFTVPREARNLHARDILSHKYLLLPTQSIDVLEKTFAR